MEYYVTLRNHAILVAKIIFAKWSEPNNYVELCVMTSLARAEYRVFVNLQQDYTS